MFISGVQFRCSVWLFTSAELATAIQVQEKQEEKGTNNSYPGKLYNYLYICICINNGRRIDVWIGEVIPEIVNFSCFSKNVTMKVLIFCWVLFSLYKGLSMTYSFTVVIFFTLCVFLPFKGGCNLSKNIRYVIICPNNHVIFPGESEGL